MLIILSLFIYVRGIQPLVQGPVPVRKSFSTGPQLDTVKKKKKLLKFY